MLMLKLIKNFASDESGATAIEYGLIAALLSVAIIAALQFVGGELSATFNAVGGALNNAIPG
jgi:pilus assembly protein Flp/PilA